MPEKLSKRSENEEKQFVNLLVAHQSLIRAFIISLLPGVPEAEDVIQSTNEVLWTKRHTFKLGTNFKAWALTTARFQVMSLQQRLKRERWAPLDDDVLAMLSEEMETDAADTMNQKLEALGECIGLLHVKDQELVLHRYWKKSGLMEYAKAAGRSVGAVKVALYRIRTMLRNCVEEKTKAATT